MPIISGPLRVNASILATLVEAAFARQSVEIREGTVRLLHGGPGRQAQIYRLTGRAHGGAETFAWSLILKTIKRSQEHATPDTIHCWQRESRIYASGYLDTLSGGLCAPRCLALAECADDQIWLWLEDVAEVSDRPWPWPRYGLAARHLGRLNGTAPVGLPVPLPPWLH